MMYKGEDGLTNNELAGDGTGSLDVAREYVEIVYPFGKYRITVRLSPSNEFLGIAEVEIDKDFLSSKQKAISKGFHDVDEFYKE